MPQRKVVAQLDIDRSLLAKYEHYERHLSKDLIIKIAYQILEEVADSKILKIAETKDEYLKQQDESNILKQTKNSK